MALLAMRRKEAMAMTKEQRAEALMRKGPIQNVRRIMELQDELDRMNMMLGQVVRGKYDMEILNLRAAVRESGL